MSTVNMMNSSLESIHQMSDKLYEAIVCLDAGCTESFQFLGAFSLLLLEHGARAVCCLEDMSVLDTVADWNATSDSARKIVIMTSCLLSDVHPYTYDVLVHTQASSIVMYSLLSQRKRSPLPTHAKNSQPQAKSSIRIHGAPLDVRIPLDNIFNKEFRAGNFQLLESIEAFLHGWNSTSSESKIQDLVDLSSKLQDDKSENSMKHLLDGCFIASESFHGTPYLEAILGRRMKDGVVLVKKWLQETLRKENKSANVKARPGFPTKSELESMIKALATSDSSLLKNKGIIQLASATLAALDDLHRDKWDAFISAEKMLQVSAGDTSQSLAAQIGDLINKSFLTRSQGGISKSSERLISVKDALFTVIVYILAGENFPTSGSTSPYSWQEEHLMKEAIVDAIIENPKLAGLKFVDSLGEELEAYRSKNSSKEKTTQQELSIDDIDDDDWGKWGDEDAYSKSNN